MENSHDKIPMHQGARPSVFENAKCNRGQNTPAEAALWEAIRLKKLDGFRFRNQHALGSFIVDFYCHEAKLAIEVDGEYHAEPNQKEYDEDRTMRIEASGVKIIRFTNHEVLTNLVEVLGKIREYLKR
jgi:very-short-patch-repair endonuclease